MQTGKCAKIHESSSLSAIFTLHTQMSELPLSSRCVNEKMTTSQTDSLTIREQRI